MSDPIVESQLREVVVLDRLREVFELLKRTFTAGGCRSPKLANAIDHTALALESAGILVGPAPEFGDTLTFDDDLVLSILCELN